MSEVNNEFVNKVASSGLITIDLEDFYNRAEKAVFDIKDCLFMGLILKEKDFRLFIKSHDWTQYQDKNVAIICSADAIVPTWAYMLLSNSLQPYAQNIYFGTAEEMDKYLILNAISKIDTEIYRDQKLVIKGCGDLHITDAAYVEITRLLSPVVKSIMYGEPCSTVPIYKRKD
ncbi:MAG: DUF2480 family protein [Bacteroidetes bacterium]|nr:DUF2480 family protein [Bacteroidota bacterium]